MDKIGFLEEAENCRRKALAYVGQPEATFLLRAAKAFEELDAQKRGLDRGAPPPISLLALARLQCSHAGIRLRG